MDLWGQIRRSIESANALTQVSVADYENVLLVLKSDVAEDYVMLHYIDRERAILRDNIDLQQKALDLANVRHLGGVASGLDVSEAETLLGHDAGRLRGTRRAASAVRARAGRPGGQTSGRVFRAGESPGLDAARDSPGVALGSPGATPGRCRGGARPWPPTTRSSAWRAPAYFPNVTLTGSGGFLSAAFTQLFTLPSLVWAAAAGAAQPLYAGGRLSAGVEHARAVYEESVDNYRQQVLAAFQEVEDGLSGLRVLEDQAAAYDKAVQSAQQTVDISTLAIERASRNISRSSRRRTRCSPTSAPRRRSSSAPVDHGPTHPGVGWRMAGFENLLAEHGSRGNARRDVGTFIAGGFRRARIASTIAWRAFRRRTRVCRFLRHRWVDG